jgi:hypothetical protein
VPVLVVRRPPLPLGIPALDTVDAVRIWLNVSA